MKQSAAKTLGVAALGAAFAVAGAGAANAAAIPDVAGTVTGLTSGLPLDQVTGSLPAGGPEALHGAQNAVNNGLTTVQPVVQQLAESDDPVDSLLGGLPTNSLPTDSLPTKGLPVSPGVPVLG
ncbi:ATP-binding protein [Streptomyces sp. NPDC016845]|uniref:ATP-binding protein n=1 Tax=Streptomyces sp. NPDC016845 TaxID=3364972 RepID=UPI0037953424